MSVTVAMIVAMPIVWAAVNDTCPMSVKKAAKYCVYEPNTRPSRSGTLTTSNEYNGAMKNERVIHASPCVIAYH